MWAAELEQAESTAAVAEQDQVFAQHPDRVGLPLNSARRRPKLVVVSVRPWKVNVSSDSHIERMPVQASEIATGSQ
jgi:hypothetical protein